MIFDNHTGLVLEGGGLRGVFTCGVLDCFMDHDIRFPFVSKITYVDGIPMLDGGIVDSIPIQYALEQGYENLVVILTRNKGYRKKASKMRIAKAFYRKYPNLQKALAQRNAAYNQTMDLIEKLEAEGQITVIRPLNPVQVGRMEKDTVKLAALYDEGYMIAQRLVTGSDDICIRKAKKA